MNLLLSTPIALRTVVAMSRFDTYVFSKLLFFNTQGPKGSEEVKKRLKHLLPKSECVRMSRGNLFTTSLLQVVNKLFAS